jgi:hypothetical protein
MVRRSDGGLERAGERGFSRCRLDQTANGAPGS